MAVFAINQVIRCVNGNAPDRIPEQIVTDALQALESIIGAEATQSLYCALTSDRAQAILQSMWNIALRRVASAREPVGGLPASGIATAALATEASATVLAPQWNNMIVPEHSVKRLFFVLIAIYAITAAIMSFYANDTTLRIA